MKSVKNQFCSYLYRFTLNSCLPLLSISFSGIDKALSRRVTYEASVCNIVLDVHVKQDCALGKRTFLSEKDKVQYRAKVTMPFGNTRIATPILTVPPMDITKRRNEISAVAVDYDVPNNAWERWSIKATTDVRYARVSYDRYNCRDCGSKLNSGHKNYFGPTKLGISLIYIL